MTNKIFTYKLFFLLFIGLLFSCSTKKNTVSTRAYHNLTAKYNVYFNANESFKSGITKAEKNFKDNFTEILPIFIFSDKSVAKSMTAEMDKTITKSAKLIKKHSIKVKPDRKKNKKGKRKKKKFTKNKFSKKLGIGKKPVVDFYKKPDYCEWVDDSYILMGKAQLQDMEEIEKNHYQSQNF